MRQMPERAKLGTREAGHVPASPQKPERHMQNAEEVPSIGPVADAVKGAKDKQKWNAAAITRPYEL